VSFPRLKSPFADAVIHMSLYVGGLLVIVTSPIFASPLSFPVQSPLPPADDIMFLPEVF